MANTINGQAAITTNAMREQLAIDAHMYSKALNGVVHRARIVIDTAADFAIDSPIVAVTPWPASGMRVFPVGIEVSSTAAGILLTKSKVGSASAVQLAKFDLAAKQPLIIPINVNCPFSVTDADGVFLLNCSAAAEILLHYVIADKLIPLGNK